MTIDAGVLNSKPVDLLCRMYTGAYTSQSPTETRDPVPSMLNALGSCAGFAAQLAVWRELILPTNRNPGDFLVFVLTKSRELFFFGDAINLFLFSSPPDRISFLTLAAASLHDASELVDIPELARHVAGSIGSEKFGQPRVPPDIDLPETPRAALTRTWAKATHILEEQRPSEWPVLLGAAAYNIVSAHKRMLAPPLAVRILLEAAVPMSKLSPASVEGSGIQNPPLTNWSQRALRPENNQAIAAEVRAVMPARPPKISARPIVINRPIIAFVNLSGTRYDAIVTKDSTEIGSMFQGAMRVVTTVPIPACDILFIYCDFEPSGKIVGQGSNLRDLIKESGASITVIASDVPPEIISNREFMKSVGRGNNPPTNLVLVNNRNGEAFGRFFKLLFEDMWAGVHMPLAWVKLAPQGPIQPPDIPGAICLMEAGQVVFGRRSMMG